MVAVVLVVLTGTTCGLGGDDQEKKIHSFQKNVETLGKGNCFYLPGREWAPDRGQGLREKFYYLWTQKGFCVLMVSG